MKIGLVGPTYEQRSLPFNAQRTINFFPVFDQQGKEVAALYGTAGLSLFATVGSGPIRGMFNSTNGRVFVVSGSGLYEVGSNGSATLRGNLEQTNGAVTIVENNSQLAVCDGFSVYILTYATNVYEKVTAAGFPPKGAGTLTFIDGYFVVNENNTGRFYISGINNGLNWGALDFATAESSPDTLKACANAIGQLWLFGDRTTEIWSNTGDSTFPFRRISGAVMEVGILAPYTAVEIDNSVFWVGRDEFGSGIIYRTRGFSPLRISTEPIEIYLQSATDLENLRAYVYQEEGHVFYVVTGGGLRTTLVYDITTQQWHEKAFNNNGELEQHLGVDHIFAFGKHLVGDRRNGNIYHQSLSYYDDAGTPLVSERIFTNLSDEGQRIRYNTLELGFETGVGLQSGLGVNPVVSMQLSKDGARTWSDWFNAPIGRVGEYQAKVKFRRLGIADTMTFKIRISDPVKRSIIGAYLT